MILNLHVTIDKMSADVVAAQRQNIQGNSSRLLRQGI